MASLGHDLATLRQKNDLSLQDIQERTRVPQHILRSIEDDSIFEQMNGNTTYTRSYVRSYAKAIGIQEAAIVEALNKVEQNSYDGSLLSEKEREPVEDNEEEKSADEKPDSKPDKNKAEKPKEKKSTPVSSSATSLESQNWNWERIGRETTVPPKRSGKTGLLIIIVLIAIVAAGFVVYTYYYADSANEQQPAETNEVQEPTTPSDSLRQALLNQDQPANRTRSSRSGNSLPDTLNIALLAAGGKLEPVRVYTDILDKQNPYWVQEGDTLRFNFVNTVRIRAVNQYERLQLLYNGHIIQNYYQEFYNDASQMVELNRSVFENHPEWQEPVE